MNTERYRRDIDGLRAIAVTVVVACHAYVPYAASGYTGVDIFFVISGFLIIGHLMQEQQGKGGIKLAEFYARRVRRLLPLLGVVLAAVLLAGLFLLTPGGEQQDLAKSAVSVTGLSANLWMHHTVWGYFAQAANTVPLLHTWTLAVEEQFYLVCPVGLVAVAWMANRFRLGLTRCVAVVLAAGAVISFALAMLGGLLWPNFSFYFTPFRAWEFALGGLIALAPVPLARRGILGLALQAAGLLAIGGALLFDGRFAETGHILLLPVAGAAALIAGGGLAPASPISRLLGSTPFRWVGRRSYGWYLWHWPLMAFARILDLGQPDLPRDVALGLVALILAAVTYTWVEQPVRQRRPGPFATTKGSLWAGFAILAGCAALAGALFAWAERPLPPDSPYAAIRNIRHANHQLSCDPTALVWPAELESCVLGDPRAERMLLVLGDSHSEHLLPGLNLAAKEANVALFPRFRYGCAPHWTDMLDDTLPPGCAAHNVATMKEIIAHKDRFAGVLLAYEWPVSDGLDASPAPLVAQLRSLGLKVLIVADGPLFKEPVPLCFARRGEACGISRQEVERQRKPFMDRLQPVVAADENIRLWDILDGLCGPAICPVYRDNYVMYRDDNHLTLAASESLTRYWPDHLRWLAGEKGSTVVQGQ